MRLLPRRRVPVPRPGPAPPSRSTKALAAIAIGTTVGVVVFEYLTVWRRGRVDAGLKSEHPLEARVEAARETVEVAVEGYRTGTPREVALLHMLISFTLSWGVIRLSTHRIRRRGRFLVFRDLKVGNGGHIHHFVPGIVVAFLAGAASIGSRNEALDRYLAIPFGLGVALTLDESALLLELDDVYWSEEGVVSVQVTLVTMVLLSLLVVSRRLLRRGEVAHEIAPEPGVASMWKGMRSN